MITSILIKHIFENSNWYFNVLRYSSDGQTEWTTSAFWGTLSKDNVYKIFYCPSDWETSSWYDFAGLSATNSAFATLALCGMHTCDSSKYGYGGYSTYYSTFVKSESDGVVSGMSAYTIVDYDGVGSTYSSDADITKNVNAYTKYQWVKWMAGGGSGPMPGPAALGRFDNLISGTDSDSSIIVIIVASSLSILSITVLSILLVRRKKKEQTN